MAARIYGPAVFASEEHDFKCLLQIAIADEDLDEQHGPELCSSTASLPMARQHNDKGEALPLGQPLKPVSPQSRQHRKRQRVREAQIIEYGYRVYTEQARERLKRAQIGTITTQVDTAKFPVSKGASTALNKPQPKDPTETPKIHKLLCEGFKYISELKSERPIVDRNGYIIGVIAAAPNDPSYAEAAKDLFQIIIQESDSGGFTADELHHKRGDFPAVNFGFTLPNGFAHPINLQNGRHEDKIQHITASPGFRRISAFQNASFAFWNPGVYTYQKSRIDRLLNEKKYLRRTSPKTIFPTTACNFKNVCCFKHRDTQNCPFGWCAITALGDFDHTKGGHLILWELKLIIEFPHGSTILIPSATITHSNTPVVDGNIKLYKRRTNSATKKLKPEKRTSGKSLLAYFLVLRI